MMYKIHSSLINILVLLLTIGFPRVYGTNIPLAVFVIPFFAHKIYKIIFLEKFFFSTIFSLSIIYLFFVISHAVLGNSGVNDTFFALQILVKLILTVLCGIIVGIVVGRNRLYLVAWILIQISVMLISAVSQEFYVFMLGFISPDSASVFENVFGLRVVGFGLFHVDGAVNFASAIFLCLMFYASSLSVNLLYIFSFPMAMAMARSALIPYVLFMIFKDGFKYKFSVFVLFLIMTLVSTQVEEGPFYEATEIFRNFLGDGRFHSDSVDHLSTMYVFPSEVYQYIWGEGRYFSQSEAGIYYNETDVGYLRGIYYSGIFYTLLYVIMHIVHIIYALISNKYKHDKDYKSSMRFLIACCFIFLILNFKGIQGISIFSFSIFFLLNKKYR